MYINKGGHYVNNTAKRRKLIVSWIMILVMLFSNIGIVMAAELVGLNNPPIITTETVIDGQPVVTVEAELADDSNIMPITEGAYFNPTEFVNAATTPETYGEVYNRIIAMQEHYPEGLTWTNYVPYGNGPLGSSYTWKGGRIAGNVTSGVGCAAFTFILSDIAFGTLPARTINGGTFAFEDVRVGDILRIYGNSHSVIVLQTSPVGVVVAEANYNSSVHWGRALSKADVMAADFLITRYPINFTPSDAPEADEVAYSGTEESLKWTLTNKGVLTISGNGAMPNYSPNDDKFPSWSTYGDKINTVVIENGVTSVGDYAFYGSKALALYLSDTVKSIGQSAFYNSELLAVTIPSSVETIGNSAFRLCENLTSASIAEGVKIIGENAFRGCTTLAYIDFPSTITSVGAGAFMDCNKMTRVRFAPGNHTVTMGDNLFTRCQMLMDVTLPEKADCISSGMFTDCLSLWYLYIPAGVNNVYEVGSLSGSPFAGCRTLYQIDFGGSSASWSSLGGPFALTYAGISNQVKVNFNVEFDDPFAKDPNDPGDLIPGEHEHNWSTSWSHDKDYHWHECEAKDCFIVNNSEKNSYASHSYGDWVIDVNATSSKDGSKHRDCVICGYRQNETIPATGEHERNYCDVNGDGLKNVQDAVLLKKHLAQMQGINIIKENSDLNDDGQINVQDAIILLKYCAGVEEYVNKFGK